MTPDSSPDARPKTTSGETLNRKLGRTYGHNTEERFSAAPQRRMTAEARRRQIIEVTLDVIAGHGLQGVTMARIAAGAGVRQASLYAHFESREAILRAALDAVYEKINASQETAGTENTLERLREMCDRHLDLWADQGEGHHAHLLLEFIAGAPGEDLRETLAAKHLESVQRFAHVVDEGQREGKIPAGVDPEQVAWMIIGWAFAGDVCHLMGFRPFYDPKIASHWLDVIFDSFARATEGPPGDPAECVAGTSSGLSKIPETLEGA